MNAINIQYVSDETGKMTSVIVPIALWQEIEAERETTYLIQSNAMKQRLLQAKNRQTGISFEETCEKLGI